MSSIFTTNAGGGVLYVDGSPVVVFDSVLSVTENLDTDATDLPIERGVDILDTAAPLPVSVTFVGSVTATPLDADEGTDTDRDLAAWDALRGLHRRGPVVSFATGSDIFEEMRIARLTRDQQGGQGANALIVSVELKQVRFAESERVIVPAQYVRRASGARAGAAPPVDAGSKPAGDAKPGEEEAAASRPQSRLRRIIRGLE